MKNLTLQQSILLAQSQRNLQQINATIVKANEKNYLIKKSKMNKQ